MHFIKISWHNEKLSAFWSFLEFMNHMIFIWTSVLCPDILYLLSENWIELLWDVILLIGDSFWSQLEYQIWICFSIDVHGMQIIGFYHINADKDMEWVIGRQALKGNKNGRLNIGKRTPFFILQTWATFL